ncbi:Hypothetical protein D9617_20g026900 [Elsinoe fawcettii]|nr:Hypothetical protein D9617_20g026900 [Elsinoe fawcettii]
MAPNLTERDMELLKFGIMSNNGPISIDINNFSKLSGLAIPSARAAWGRLIKKIASDGSGGEAADDKPAVTPKKTKGGKKNDKKDETGDHDEGEKSTEGGKKNKRREEDVEAGGDEDESPSAKRTKVKTEKVEDEEDAA